jgi:hypothetical protein
MPRRARSTKASKRSSNPRLWVRNVTTESTFPPKGLFTKDAHTIARVLATKKVSPKGTGSAIRMVQYFINRGGKNLSAAQRRELESAKHLLQQKRDKEQGRTDRAKRVRISRRRSSR